MASVKSGKKTSQKVFIVIAIVGFLFMLSGMGFTAWFLSTTPEEIGTTPTEAADGDGGQNKAACDSLTISKAIVNSMDEPITISAKGSDLDGTLGEIMIYVAAGGQKNTNAADLPCTPADSFYCNHDDVHSFIARKSNSDTVSVTTTFADLKKIVDEKVSSSGIEYEGNLDEKGVLIVVNAMGQFSTDLCSSNIARVNGAGAYYGTGSTAWESTCKGGCFQSIMYEKIDPPTDLTCNVECGGEKGTCGGGLECVAGFCREPLCDTESDCVCNENPIDIDDVVVPIWGISKSGRPACQSTAQGDIAVMTYSTIVRNSSTVPGELQRIEDVLDTRIPMEWIDSSSLPEYAVVTKDSKTGGVKIVWTIPSNLQTVASGQTKTFTFKLNVPVANFGTYASKVTAYPVSGYGSEFTTTVQNDVSCLIPSTGLFDTTENKLLGALLLVAMSIGMIGLSSTDRGVLKLISGTSRLKDNTVEGVKERYGKEARISKTREKFEKDL